MSHREPIWPNFSSAVEFAPLQSTYAILDASTEYALYAGEIDAPFDTWVSGTKSIVAIELCASAKANGGGTTTVRGGIGDWHATAGPPIQPDAGGMDQTGTIDITSITAGTPFTITLGAARTVSRFDKLVVKVDFSAYGTGTPTLTLITLGPNDNIGTPQTSNFVGGALAGRGGWPSIVFITDTGERLYFTPAFGACSTSAWQDFHVNTTGTALDGGDERGAKWVVKYGWDIDFIEAWVRVNVAASEAEVVLYRDTTALKTFTLKGYHAFALNNINNYPLRVDPPIRVYPGDNIYLTLRPLDTNAWRVYRNQMHHADDRRILGLEWDVSFVNRINQAGWNEAANFDLSWPSFRIWGTRVVGRAGYGQLVSGMVGR